MHAISVVTEARRSVLLASIAREVVKRCLGPGTGSEIACSRNFPCGWLGLQSLTVSGDPFFACFLRERPRAPDFDGIARESVVAGGPLIFRPGARKIGELAAPYVQHVTSLAVDGG